MEQKMKEMIVFRFESRGREIKIWRIEIRRVDDESD